MGSEKWKFAAWLQTGGGVYYVSDTDISDILFKKVSRRTCANAPGATSRRQSLQGKPPPTNVTKG